MGLFEDIQQDPDRQKIVMQILAGRINEDLQEKKNEENKKKVNLIENKG